MLTLLPLLKISSQAYEIDPEQSLSSIEEALHQGRLSENHYSVNDFLAEKLMHCELKGSFNLIDNSYHLNSRACYWKMCWLFAKRIRIQIRWQIFMCWCEGFLFSFLFSHQQNDLKLWILKHRNGDIRLFIILGRLTQTIT